MRSGRLDFLGLTKDRFGERAGSRISMTLFAATALSVLIALGLWQLERRAWKNDLISRFELSLSKSPLSYEPPLSTAQQPAREFTRVTVSGTLQNAQSLKVLSPTPEAARSKTKEGFGYLIFTPLKFAKGIVFVNRGFVPAKLAEEPAFFPNGEVTITGILRVPEKPAFVTPSPDLSRRLFYARDIPAMATAAGIDADVITTEYIQAEPSSGVQEWPQPADPREMLAGIPNRHLEYALTWFGLAVALALVYRFYMLRE